MTSPKAKALSNHEIVTLAVFLLGGDAGDSLRILFDLKAKTAVAELGQTSVEEVAEVAAQSP